MVKKVKNSNKKVKKLRLVIIFRVGLVKFEEGCEKLKSVLVWATFEKVLYVGSSKENSTMVATTQIWWWSPQAC